MWIDPAIQKTFAILVLIGIGILLRGKIQSKEALSGVKVLILSIALPATIFIALLKIEVDTSLLYLPLGALVFNLLFLSIAFKGLPLLGFDKGGSSYRTMLMLLPSLAPGLSCFPFLAEYFGDESLAMAALADVGNKVFVLVLLYLLAMHWYYKGKEHSQKNGRLKSLVLSLLKEPVNLVIVLALLLLGVGMNFQSLPAFLQNSIGSMSAMMTPMILLFIGMAVKIKWDQFRKILQILMIRSGLGFLFSTALLFTIPEISPALLMVFILFPQSACSFWPFAHMAAVNQLEEGETKKTFDLDMGLGVLACSLPFSCLLILAICSMGSMFSSPFVLLLSAGGMFTFASLTGLKPYLSIRPKTHASMEEVKTG